MFPIFSKKHSWTDWDASMLRKFFYAYLNKPRKLHEYSMFRYISKTNKVNNIYFATSLRMLWNKLSLGQHADIHDLRRLNPLSIFPYERIPNVSVFKISKLKEFHPILKMVHIFKRMGKAEYEKIDYINEPINDYLEYMFGVLNNSRHNPEKFWFFAEILMKKSKSFKMSCIRKIFPLWYKNMSLKKMNNIISEYDNLNRERFNYKRVEIPKANGKLRSLGVPTPGWRIYQTGLNMIILIWLSTYQHRSQHGFIPGKGTDSAWKQLHEEVIDAKYIYEFDLKEFFDRVNLDYLSKTLKQTGIPKELVHQLIG